MSKREDVGGLLGPLTMVSLVTELGPGLVTCFILLMRCLGALHGTSLAPGGRPQGTRFGGVARGGAHGTRPLGICDPLTSFRTRPASLGEAAAGAGTSLLVTFGLEAATGEGRDCSLFFGGRPRPLLGGVVGGLVSAAEVGGVELTWRESLSEVSESELRLNF